MTFKPKSEGYKFTKISIDNFIEKYKMSNPKEDLAQLRRNILHIKQLKKDGIKCDCGNSLWVIGSAISGKGCFTCITGETDFSDDYEID
ncbi:hypothetical protein QTN47_17705 [Danxiaibacter flavus]|uniref:Uncharacterized protein n=1 Tax=Danxiaibacter flavus TaxID=3049108 RepID=A0ABV3ZHH5_9BACT|nr:hypothetical protein QNM32_17715 [Chitinophagaceae bacterium DXS]